MNEQDRKKRVTGIGGVFFKTKDPDQLKGWYNKHLGIQTDQYGATFKFRQWPHPEKSGYLQWSTFKEASDYFEPSPKNFMINYRVADLEWLVQELKKEGVTVCDEIETFDYGKFVHIMDPEGNKLQLWEPIDEGFDKYYEQDESRPVNF